MLKCSLQSTTTEKRILVIPVEVQRSQAAAKSHWWEVTLQGLLKVYLQLDSCTCLLKLL